MNNSPLDTAIKAAKTAGNLLLEYQNSQRNIDIEEKNLNDLVTNYDTESEKIIISILKGDFPDFGIIAEEGGISKISPDKPYWIIDPIDGTSNFIHRFPIYCVSIGLCLGNDHLCGVIYNPALNELFYAQKEEGAYLNGNRIRVSGCLKLKEAMIATGFPFRSYDLLDRYMDCANKLLRNCHDIRRAGAAAVDLAYVACGRLDAYFEYGLQPWDAAAGAIILKEAGGTVTDFGGGNDYLFGRTLISSNTTIHEELLSIISNNLPHKYLSV